MEKTKKLLNWLVKYKLYHIPFWLGYHILWWTLTIGSFVAVISNIIHTAYSFKFLFYVVFEALGAYFVMYFLVPRLLEKGKIVLFAFCFILTAIITAVLIVPGYPVSAWLANEPMASLYGRSADELMYFFKINTLPSATAALTLALSIKLTKNWIQSKKRQQILEKEKLETELKFLKSQFNPHFLFNSINSIFVLIHKNPDMASESLAKFSDLLRYQLYDCNETLIPLGQEIVYVENFIELEKLRQEKNLELSADLDIPRTSDLMIAPFILMPFIENAFKHVSKYNDRKNEIELYIAIHGNTLQLKISNSVSAHHRLPDELLKYKGIGLKNVARRLDLIYEEKHELKVSQTADRYEVLLLLHLETVSKIKSEQKETETSFALNA